jgi:DNA-binding phage protein
MAKRVTSIVAELRKAIRAAERRGLTRYKLAKAADMPRSQLTRVATGESVPTLTTAERILWAAGYRLAILPIVAKEIRRT